MEETEPELKKLSKSDKIDKEQEAKTREFFQNRPKCQHFELGTYVHWNRNRYLVRDIFGESMLIEDEDGQTQMIRPYALMEWGHDMTVEKEEFAKTMAALFEEDEAADELVEEQVKLGNAAPDWGRRYGIRDLWTEVQEGLWVGGTHDDDTVALGRGDGESYFAGFTVRDDAEIGPDEFDAVVTLYAWARPVDWLVEEYRWGIFDGGSEPDIDTIRDVVVWAHKRWKSGKKVLLRCQAGLSRSTFFTALVLVRDGMEVQQAVDLIRHERSGHCLNVNGSAAGGAFTKILYNTPVEFWRE